MTNIIATLHRLCMPAVWGLAIVFVLIGTDRASAVVCNGTNSPAPCFVSGSLKPGTCDTNGSCVANNDPDGTCTSDSEFDVGANVGGTAGIVTVIIKNVKNILMGDSTATPATPALWTSLYSGITGDPGFRQTVSGALVLYVMIYGATFMLGMTQLTVFDLFLRMTKIGIVALLLNGGGQGTFTTIVVHFFNDGTDDIINRVSTINDQAMQGNPFDWMDTSIRDLTSTKMLVTLMAAASTGPYGVIIIAILTISLYTYVKAMLYALWVYIMAMAMRTLLFGLAPLFIACLLFQRTRHLFDGWLNQVVNSCLQPIFLFTFFAFFLQLILSQFDLIMGLDVCWTEQALFAGAPNEAHYWRFAIFDCNANQWVPFIGQWDFEGPVGLPLNTGCSNPVHPMGIMVPIILWILTDLAKRFNFIVISIAKDVANASTDFDYHGKPLFGRNVKGDTRAVGAGPRAAPPGAGAAPRAGPPSLLPPAPVGPPDPRARDLGRANRGRTATEARKQAEELAGRRLKPK